MASADFFLTRICNKYSDVYFSTYCSGNKEE